jgi:hypothetical protein
MLRKSTTGRETFICQFCPASVLTKTKKKIFSQERKEEETSEIFVG